jgi:hypothetical protein
MAGTAVAGPPGGYMFTSLLGFGARCPMRTPGTKLVFVNNLKKTGLSRIVTDYRYKGCIGKSVKTMTLPWLQPHVPGDDHKLIPAKGERRRDRSFASNH